MFFNLYSTYSIFRTNCSPSESPERTPAMRSGCRGFEFCSGHLIFSRISSVHRHIRGNSFFFSNQSKSPYEWCRTDLVVNVFHNFLFLPITMNWNQQKPNSMTCRNKLKDAIQMLFLCYNIQFHIKLNFVKNRFGTSNEI